ncbi:hypothetical protein FE697_007245 [Mumia zhuanghuii]|uniref:Uncharacterized protein n=2 Tax=Mumia TaxID=1546255 RepID=A0ABW1QML0_9ACTN|nr:MULTISPECIES: hypothetical protein [Mumia]KAA1423399.1 hypothetical protein FE697_007245 [Mumia zhuanghuii]
MLAALDRNPEPASPLELLLAQPADDAEEREAAQLFDAMREHPATHILSVLQPDETDSTSIDPARRDAPFVPREGTGTYDAGRNHDEQESRRTVAELFGADPDHL